VKVWVSIRTSLPSSPYCKRWVFQDYSMIVNVKYPTRGVLSQDRNLTELAGICINGGTCGLMR